MSSPRRPRDLMMFHRPALRPVRHPALGAARALPLVLLAAACSQPLDYDMRGAFGNAPSTAQAARDARIAPRPAPDARGIISYPSYQVAVARRDDTLTMLAMRIGADPQALARYNGVKPGDTLREGEVVVLPERVAEPEGGPIRTQDGVDITTLADNAIRRADKQSIETTSLDPATPSTRKAPPASSTALEPIRHRVERGETAYSIARLYHVSVRSLADWNGLSPDFSVHEGQQLLIPVNLPKSAPAPSRSQRPPAGQRSTAVTPPGSPSPTPAPPSASEPLPDEKTAPASQMPKAAAAPDLSKSTTAATNDTARLAYPVTGDIVRDYKKGSNEGIDIAASAGTPVKAAADGTVAAVTEDTAGVPIIVLKHADNLLTVYSNLGNVAVKKGDTVKRGQKLAEIRTASANALHFEVREGFDSTDPMPYLQ